MVKREAQQKIKELAKKFKAIAVTGARQTGKTTLLKTIFKSKPYVSLESPDIRRYASDDPRGFLSNYPKGAILDEIQRVPELFSYLQEILDNTKEKGLFILSGSNNFLLQQNISQSLAGRVAYLNLLPFSLKELQTGSYLAEDTNTILLNGAYPPIYDQQIAAKDWCSNYFRTYIEKDIRLLKNISDLNTFEKLVYLLAGRTGQELNIQSLAVEVGVDHKTIQAWISLLESSFILFLLRPHHANFNKTIVKRPKVYFYDTAIVCFLLGIKNIKQLQLHPFRGAIFETMVVSELVKQRTNKGELINLYYWRDKTGHEIDIIIDNGDELIPIEIKAGQTATKEYFKNIKYWQNLSGQKTAFVLYAGEFKQKHSDGITLLPYQDYFLKKNP